MNLKELDLHITNRCNYRCAVCCFTSNEKHLVELDTKELMAVIDQAIDLGCEAVHITGGEPLVRPDVVPLVAYMSAKGLEVRLQTNGALLTEELAAKLAGSGLAHIMFSLDSLDESTNRRQRAPFSLPQVVAAIESAAKQGMDVRVNAVLTRLNVDDLVPLTHYVAQLGVKTVSAFYFSPIGRGRRHRDWWLTPNEYLRAYSTIIDEFMRQKEEGNIPSDVDFVLEKGYSHWSDASNISLAGFTGCGAGCAHVYNARDYLIVRCDGAVYPCILTIDWDESLGNVREMALERIWRNSAGWELLNREGLYETCGSCPHWSLCNGGCAGYSKRLTNDHSNKDPRCVYGEIVPLCPIMKYNVRNDTLGGSSDDVI